MWKGIILISILASGDCANFFELNFKQSTNKVVVGDYFYKLEYSVYRNNEKIQTVNILTGLGGNIKSRLTPKGFILSGRGDDIEFTIESDEPNYSQFSVSRRNILKKTADCVDLHTPNVHWYGGNEQRNQHYPIERLIHKHNAYVSKEEFNQAIAERYWLSSNGVYFYVNEDAPLFLDMNNDYIGYMCFEVKHSLPYDVHTSPRFNFIYHVGIGINARDTHFKAIEKFLGKPVGHPAEEMVREPIWSTWARYKAEINEQVLMTFANEIISNGYNGQFEIDDAWEICYGATEFSTQVFPNINTVVSNIKGLGFDRVTLWIHPFINKNCSQWLTDAKDRGYLVTDRSGNFETQWWNSQAGEAAYIDFTNPNASSWFVDKLRLIQKNAGITSFKFDAGETSWSPIDPVYHSGALEYPHKIVKDYVRTCAKFGDLVEVRSAQKTQDLPIFVRMIDKDTEWSDNNGLRSLITTMLQMNMVGYPFVLPDMIGGNGYNNVKPDSEIFVRWLQANVFMPSIQFSFVPWDYADEPDVLTYSHTFMDLHAKYTPLIMQRFNKAVATGDPVNPPIWWIAPNDKIAQRIDDEFLLGEEILVAPVVDQGRTSRDIYLPAGHWTDGNNATNVYNVGSSGYWIRDYPAPISILPYFIKQ